MAVGQGFRVHYLINVNDARLRGYHRFLVVQSSDLVGLLPVGFVLRCQSTVIGTRSSRACSVFNLPLNI